MLNSRVIIALVCIIAVLFVVAPSATESKLCKSCVTIQKNIVTLENKLSLQYKTTQQLLSKSSKDGKVKYQEWYAKYQEYEKLRLKYVKSTHSFKKLITSHKSKLKVLHENLVNYQKKYAYHSEKVSFYTTKYKLSNKKIVEYKEHVVKHDKKRSIYKSKYIATLKLYNEVVTKLKISIKNRTRLEKERDEAKAKCRKTEITREITDLIKYKIDVYTKLRHRHQVQYKLYLTEMNKHIQSIKKYKELIITEEKNTETYLKKLKFHRDEVKQYREAIHKAKTTIVRYNKLIQKWVSSYNHDEKLRAEYTVKEKMAMGKYTSYKTKWSYYLKYQESHRLYVEIQKQLRKEKLKLIACRRSCREKCRVTSQTIVTRYREMIAKLKVQIKERERMMTTEIKKLRCDSI